MANKKYIVGGKVYEETAERKVIVGGKVLQETTAAGGTDYTLTADAGALTITGTTTNLEHARALVADAGAVDITGTDAGLVHDYSLALDAGAVAITGADATLSYGFNLPADAARFNVFSSGNLLTYSEQFDHADWAGAATVTPNTATAPDGSLTADELEDTDGGGTQFTWQTDAMDSTAWHTASIYIKKDAIARATRFCRVALYFWTGGTAELNSIFFDTSTGVYSTSWPVSTPGAAGVDDAGDYWRVHIQAKPVDTDNTLAAVLLYPAAGANETWTLEATATGAFTAWGAQINEGDLALYRRTEATASANRPVGLIYDRVLSAEAGAVAVTGFDANLVGPGTVYTLPADAGAFSVGGVSASLLVDHRALADTGSITITGLDGSLLYYRNLSADVGAFDITGFDANLVGGLVPVTVAIVASEQTVSMTLAKSQTITQTITQTGKLT